MAPQLFDLIRDLQEANTRPSRLIASTVGAVTSRIAASFPLLARLTAHNPTNCATTNDGYLACQLVTILRVLSLVTG